jgi:hypothetical protein
VQAIADNSTKSERPGGKSGASKEESIMRDESLTKFFLSMQG